MQPGASGAFCYSAHSSDSQAHIHSWTPHRDNLTTKLPSSCKMADESPLLDSSLSPATILSPAVSLSKISGALEACNCAAGLAQVPVHGLGLCAACQPIACGLALQVWFAWQPQLWGLRNSVARIEVRLVSLDACLM